MTTTPQESRALLGLVLIAPAPSIGAAYALWIAPGTATGSIAYTLGKLWLYALPVVWLLFVERGRLGLSKPARAGLGVGALTGVLLGGAIWAGYALLAETSIDPEALRRVVFEAGIDTKTRYLLASAWLVVVNAALEEYAFRWFVLRQCERLVPVAMAVALAAAIFTAHHVIVLRAFFAWDVTLLASAGVFAGGVTWSWLYRRYRSIWPGYVSHVVADVAILAIGWKLLFG